MKRICFIVWVALSFQSTYSQEITNFYLEPGSTANEVTLHTSFFYHNVAGLYDSNIEIVDNVINASLCYALFASTSPTFDDQEFTINLPSLYPNFILNVNLFIYDHVTDECDYANRADSGVFIFDFPISATATTLVPDDTFEAYFENQNLGDDILDNNFVFTHKVQNLKNLDLDYWSISTLGPRIEDLTGHEVIYRLKKLKMDDNAIIDFDGSKNPKLEYIRITNDQLESVNLLLNNNLEYLEIGGENFADLDISGNTKLETVELIGGASITELDLSHQIELTNLSIRSTGISSLDLTNNQQLISAGFKDNAMLTNLILGDTPSLTGLSCLDNALEILDVSTLPSLQYLNASGNDLTNIDLSMNTMLRDVNVSENRLMSLDFSSNPNIEYIVLRNNELISLNLKNGFSQNITFVRAINNPDLYCIDVDDEVLAPYGNTWTFNQPVIYSENCSLGLNDSERERFVIYPNPVRDLLTIESKENIESTQVYTMLGELLASEKGASQIDFSSYAKGVYFLKVDTEKGAAFQKVLKE